MDHRWSVANQSQERVYSRRQTRKGRGSARGYELYDRRTAVVRGGHDTQRWTQLTSLQEVHGASSAVVRRVSTT